MAGTCGSAVTLDPEMVEQAWTSRQGDGNSGKSVKGTDSDSLFKELRTQDRKGVVIDSMYLYVFQTG